MRAGFSHLIINDFAAGAFAMGLVLAALWPSNTAAENWLTFHYDNARDGANTNEVVLTPANVNVSNFFKLFTYAVDAEVYAQPLYVSNVAISGQGTHNVVFVATENDTVYAFDADSNAGPNGGLLWQTNLGIAATSTQFGVRYHHNVLNPLIGITGTPVIDPVAGTLYVDVFSGNVTNTTACLHRIHALKIADGTEQPYSPVVVAASVPGTGVDSSNGVVAFRPNQHMNRPAMTLAGGMLFVGYGSYGDTDPYHGWVIGFNAANLEQLTNYVFATTPNATTNAFGINAGEGALWMGGNGLCVDAGGNLYLESGNGSFSANTNGGDYGDSFVKLSVSNQLAVADYFSPSNQASMALNDLDLGSGGPMLLPDSAGSPAHRHLMVGAGKEGTIYLVDRDNMGHFSPTQNQIVQTANGVIGGSYGVPAYFNNWIYYQGSGDVDESLRDHQRRDDGHAGSPIHRDPRFHRLYDSHFGQWNKQRHCLGDPDRRLQQQRPHHQRTAVLHAFNATNLAQELYNSSQNLSRDNPGGAIKYTRHPRWSMERSMWARSSHCQFLGLEPVARPDHLAQRRHLTNSVTVTLADAAMASRYITRSTAPRRRPRRSSTAPLSR